MTTTTLRRRLVAGATAAALVAGGTVLTIATAGTAQADSTVTGGELDWGFRANFRTYVGNQTAALPPIGAVPENERINVIAPAVFDAAGTPSVTGKDYTKPYTFPVTGSSVTSPTALDVQADGGVVYNFPSHAFTVTVEDPQIVVNGSSKTLVADLEVVVPENTVDQTPGTYGGENVTLANIASVNTVVAPDRLSATVTGTGLTITTAGATALANFLQAGSDLDNFTATVTVDEPIPAQPTVKVSKTVVNPAGDTVTVTGTGFDPASSIGTRPPLLNQPSGAYVVFGTFLDVWKPSLGSAVAPSSSRKGWTQKWAVPAAALPTIEDGSGNGVVLNPDGTFTATLEVKRGFPEALANGNYGIYTYPGSGGSNAAFETYTPISFIAPSTTSLTVSRATYGTPAKATVAVKAPAGTTATGTVTVKEGARTLGTAKLAGGRATVTLPKTLAVGTRSLTAAYSGDANLFASTTSTKVVVAKATATTTIKLAKKKLKAKQRGKVTVTVKATGVTPAGKILVKDGKKTVAKVTLTVGKNGKVTIKLPKLKKGKHKISAVYQGSSTTTADASSKKTLRVV